MSASILHSPPEQLQHAQAKLTYLGPQTKPIATVVLHTAGQAPALHEFRLLHESGQLYPTDDLPYTQFVPVTPEELANVLHALKSLLSAADSGTERLVAFAVMRRQKGKWEGQEFKVGAKNARLLYVQILGAIAKENDSARQAVQKQYSAIFGP